MNLLEAVINAFRLPELRNKLLFTAFLLIVFGIIWLRDKAKGGYKPVRLTD